MPEMSGGIVSVVPTVQPGHSSANMVVKEATLSTALPVTFTPASSIISGILGCFVGLLANPPTRTYFFPTVTGITAKKITSDCLEVTYFSLNP